MGSYKKRERRRIQAPYGRENRRHTIASMIFPITVAQLPSRETLAVNHTALSRRQQLAALLARMGGFYFSTKTYKMCSLKKHPPEVPKKRLNLEIIINTIKRHKKGILKHKITPHFVEKGDTTHGGRNGLSFYPRLFIKSFERTEIVLSKAQLLVGINYSKLHIFCKAGFWTFVCVLVFLASYCNPTAFTKDDVGEQRPK